MAKRNIVDDRNRFKAIRRLCNPFPPDTAGERLAQISDVAMGKAEPDFRASKTSPDLAERLEAGRSSRAPRIQDKPPVAEKKRTEEKKRAEKRGRDRSEKSTMNRTTDVNV